MSLTEQIRPASAKARLILQADCTTCGRLHDDAVDSFTVPSLAIAHTTATGHVVVLNGTSDSPEEPEATTDAPPQSGTFYVDLPTVDCIGNADGAWQNVAEYRSRTQAIQFARNHFGADEQGCVCLVSG